MTNLSVPVGVKQTPWNKSRFYWAEASVRAEAHLGHSNMGKWTRALAMFDLAIDSKLRGCDLVCLRIADVALHRTAQGRATVIQRKTGHPVQFEITEQTRASVRAWLYALEGNSE